MSNLTPLPAYAFDKEDVGDDLAFYAPARLVTHLDDAAISALTSYYKSLVPEGVRILDLMSSWVSHLPDKCRYSEVVGHGMNAEELAANPRLDQWFVQDLNAEPTLTLDSQTFGGALCCVGVQYLQRPYQVFAEVSFSNRCFPTKAVAVWKSLDMSDQASLVRHYFATA